MLNEPLTTHAAKKLVAQILAGGDFTFSGHAMRELAKDGLSTVDALNVLRGGISQPAEWENGGWRYGFTTPRMKVVVAFESETELVVVTCWRYTR